MEIPSIQYSNRAAMFEKGCSLPFWVNGRGLVEIPPERQKVTREDFRDEILHAIYPGSLGGWRLGPLTHLTLIFDKSSLHNAKRVSERLTKFGFLRLVHPPCSPHLRSCDFFLLSYLRE
jgi:hypothetical protein